MKRRIAIVAGGLAAAVGLAVAPTVVQADSPKDKPGDAVPNQTELEKIKNSWTPQRMKKAEPLVVDAPKNVEPVKHQPGKPKVIKGTTASVSTKSAALEDEPGAPVWDKGGEVVKTTGKVFFTSPDGGDFVCSASVVPAKNKSLVSTAGHCVNDAQEQPVGTPGEYVSDFVFVPAYDGTASTPEEQAPYGVWPASSLSAHTQWASHRDDTFWNFDVAFAVLAPQGGENIEQVTGSQSIAFNQKRNQFVAAFGFPAEAPFDGTTLRYSSGTSFTDENGSTDEGIDSDLNGGASGGPWFQDFDENSGTGVQISVNSFTYLDGEGNRLPQMYGPYFGTSVQRLYEAVAD